jgi:hypothetical protein
MHLSLLLASYSSHPRRGGSDVPHSSELWRLSSLLGETFSFATPATGSGPASMVMVGWPVSRWAAKGSVWSLASEFLLADWMDR